jgi:hypothetical protein
VHTQQCNRQFPRPTLTLPFVDRFMAVLSPGLLAPMNRYVLRQCLVADNMSQGRKTGLNSAPLIRIYPGSWTLDTWVDMVIKENRTP